MSAKQLILFPLLIALACFPAFADADLIVLTDKEQYHTGETATVSGIIVEKKMPVIAMRLYDPDGVIISANNVEIDELNTFSRTVSLDSPFFDKSGTYTVKFDYGKAKVETTFEVIGSQAVSYPPDIEIIPEATPEVLSINTGKPSYQDGDFITVSGTVSAIGEPSVLIGIYDPFGTPTGFYFGDVNPELGFSTSFLAKEGVNFKTLGTYTIKAHYGESKIETEFEFKATEVKEIPTTEKKTDSTPVLAPASQNLPIVQDNQRQQTTETEITRVQNSQAKTESEKPQEDTRDNLSVNDIELGKMLNQIVLDCDSSEYVDSISYNEGMGPALMRLCKYDSAISYFDQSLEKNPDDVQSLTNKGSALSKLGQYDDAMTYYDLALKIEPSYLPAMNNKANALSELGDYRDAILLYNSVLDIEPTHAVAQENLEKAKKKLAMLSKSPEESDEAPIVTVSVPQKTEVQYETEKQFEATEIHEEKPNILEQIGSVFSFLGVNVFGFMK